MKRFPSVQDITPEQFELQVKSWLESVSIPLEEFKAVHLDKLNGLDGEYTIDVTVRFKALAGAQFLTVVECKKHKNSIKREVVQALREKQLSLGAQKAMIFATADFQSGAIEYAGKHGIALVQIVNGAARYIQNNAARNSRAIPENADDYVGLFYGSDPTGKLIYPQLVSSEFNVELAEYLHLSNE
jgi:restriction system protein